MSNHSLQPADRQEEAILVPQKLKSAVQIKITEPKKKSRAKPAGKPKSRRVKNAPAAKPVERTSFMDWLHAPRTQRPPVTSDATVWIKNQSDVFDPAAEIQYHFSRGKSFQAKVRTYHDDYQTGES